MANTTKTILLGGAIIAVSAIIIASIMIGGAAPAGAAIETPIATTATTVTNGVQDVKLSFKNYEYVLEPDTFQEGVPVRMTVDLNTVTGCMRSIVISAFGVRKTVSAGDNIIEFTPNKAGTFNIACIMNMGRGRFTVLKSDGTASDFIEETAAPDGDICDANGGSCGCGS